MKGPSRKEREHRQRRSEILQAALQLFADKGFHGTSMQEIAERSEFAVGTLYKFFENKERIYRTLIEETARSFHGALMAAVKGKGEEHQRLLASIETKIRVFQENLEFVRIYFAETQGATYNVKTGLEREIKALYEEYLTALAGLFRRGIRKGIFRRGDPYLLALALDAISNAFLVESMEHPNSHTFDAATILDLFVKGAGKPKEGRS